MQQPPIEDYALIGDLETAALVSRTGSIDWLCWPRFDSPACFAALLGSPENGRWKIAPAGGAGCVTRRYREGTLILESEFETEDGAATLIDFMPPRDGTSDLVRLVIGRRGTVRFKSDLVIRFDYGRTLPWVSRLEDGALSAIAGPDLLVLRTPVHLQGRNMHTQAKFTVTEGETVGFTLTHISSTQKPPRAIDPEEQLEKTEAFWLAYSDRCPDIGPYTAVVKRSLITLKALTYEPTGGMVAAVTTSLPEWIGGSRNWDYRYCWVRDATLTLLAFMKLGYYEEASAWRDWLLRVMAGAPEQVQIMYGLAGERRLAEWEVPWLTGYHNSLPVRVGNAAAAQFQLDIYGEIADALTHAVRGGLPPHPRDRQLRPALLRHLEKVWREPDEGIWEVRGPRRHFTHSKVMAWVAFDRASTMADNAQEAQRWRAIADEIHAEVCARGFDPELGSFVQSYGSKALDASLLLIPLVGFLECHDPRVLGTVAMVERRLLRDGFVLRYDTDGEAGVDGLPPGEGAFLACSFWLADNYVLAERLDEAHALFERLLACANDLGLLAEEYDPVAGRLLGNFPQAFSHVGLINTALNLARQQGPARDRAEVGLGMAEVG